MTSAPIHSRRELRFLAPWLVLALVLAFLPFHAWRFGGHDFPVYQRAGERFLSGAPLYVEAPEDMPYRYAPGLAALFTPLTLLGARAGKAAWLALLAAAALAAVLALAASGREAAPPHGRSAGNRAAWAPPVAMLLLLRPLVDELHNCNVNVVALALALAAVVADERDRPWLAGGLLATAVALKVAPLLLALDWLRRRRGSSLTALAVCGLGLIALPALTYGPRGALELHRAWIASERAYGGVRLDVLHNQSAWAVAAWYGLGRWGGALLAAAAVIAAASARPAALRQALLFLAMPLAMPTAWIQNYVFALPVAALLLLARPRVAVGAALLAASVWIPSTDVAGRAAEAWLEARKMVGLEMLALFAYAALVGRAGAWGAPATRAEARPGSPPYARPA